MTQIIRLILSVLFAITTTPWEDSNPDVDGSLVAWQSYRDETGWDVYGYDMSTGVEFVIANSAASEYMPRVSGNRVTWLAQYGNEHQVWYKNLATNDTHLVISSTVQAIYSLDIDEQYIAYANRSINLYNVDTGATAQMKQPINVFQDHPRLDLPWLVWRQSGAIIGYNISTTEVVTLAISDGVPGLGGGVLVYPDAGVLNGLRISTGECFTVALTDQVATANTNGRYVAWADANQVHLYNIATGEQAVLDALGRSPEIDAGLVVWKGVVDSAWNILAVSPVETLPTARMWFPVTGK